jgi:hypothetical protein
VLRYTPYVRIGTDTYSFGTPPFVYAVLIRYCTVSYTSHAGRRFPLSSVAFYTTEVRPISYIYFSLFTDVHTYSSNYLNRYINSVAFYTTEFELP